MANKYNYAQVPISCYTSSLATRNSMHISQQKSSFPSTVACELALKILNRIPPEHRQSFTSEQILALQTALAGKQPKPVFKVTLGPLYVSLGMKSPRRIKTQNIKQSMLAPALCMMVSMVGMGCVAGLLKFRDGYQTAYANDSLSAQKSVTHSTVLPFRKDQSTCENNGGVWAEQECIDHGHSPTF